MARTTSPGGEREMDGVEKAATLLITLGPENQLKYLNISKKKRLNSSLLKLQIQAVFLRRQRKKF